MTPGQAARRPRVLMLTPQSPYPPHQGTTIRNYNLLVRLAQHADVTLVTFVDPGQPVPEETPLAGQVRRIIHFPTPQRTTGKRLRDLVLSPLPDLALRLHHPQMKDAVAALAREDTFDILLVEGLEMAPYMTVFLAHVSPAARPRVVFDAHNAEYILQYRAFRTDMQRPARWHAALYSLVQWLKLRRYERRIIARADHIVTVSQVDRENLQRLGVRTPMTTVPNGVDLAYYGGWQAQDTPHPLIAPASVVFTGKMDYRPNVDAVLWFIEWVWPHVLEAVPEAQFYVVGRSPHPRLMALTETPGVFITGEVPDVRPYIHAARVYVAPLRVGGGTRLKLLEAMAMRKAIVSTPLGAEGYPVRDGEHLLLADTPDAFAAAVLSLLHDAPLRERLGEAAYHFVAEHYDWDALFPRFLNVLLQATEHKEGTP